MYRPCLHCDGKKYDEDYCPEICTYGEARKQLKELEDTVALSVPHGRWKRVKWVPETIEGGGCIEGGYWIVRCTNCSIPTDTESRYCPHCGAKMDLEDLHE